MLNKNLIEEKFKKSIETYDDNAIIQKIMAKKLISLINKKDFENILEIGSYSGILTRIAIEKFNFQNYLALDIVDSFEKIKNLSPKIKFQQIDVENFKTKEKFDLIIANASLQWCNNFENTIKNLKSYLTNGGILAITTFASDNFFEIRNSFNTSLNYKTIQELEKIFSSNAKIIQEIHAMQFNSPNELLKHLKLTGVNAINKNAFSLKEIKKGLEIIEKEYQNKLTYKPVYIID
mgnify:CR=1 FL=1